MRCDGHEGHGQGFITTQQLRQGHEVLIARTSTPTCQVTISERYIAAAEVAPMSDLYLFRDLSVSGYLQRKGQREAESFRVFELYHSQGAIQEETGGPWALSRGLWPPQPEGRRCPSAAAQAGILDRLFKQHGRWNSESAKDSYIEDSKGNRLSVSENIGI